MKTKIYHPLTLYKRMLTIRAFEKSVEALFISGKLSGTVHTCIGQEATAVGVGSVLTQHDLMTSTHRGHGHFIGKGGDINRMMAEMFGKSDGYSKGRGGSQLMSDYTIGFMGGNGIVAGSLPVATGMALHLKQHKKNGIVVAFLGDGAVNQGSFHESLNMAGLWELPIIFICENNLYSMSTPLQKGMANPYIAFKGEMYELHPFTADGNDIDTVIETTKQAKEYALDGAPCLIEFKTYRLSGHSRGDQRIYRTREEENLWKQKDPIIRYRNQLMAQGLLDPEKDAEINNTVSQDIENAITFAEQSPFPAPQTVTQGVYAHE